MDVATGVVDTCDNKHTVDTVVIDMCNNERMVNVVIGVIVKPVLRRLADADVGVVEVDVAPSCVAAVDKADNDMPFFLTIFLFLNPSVNKAFTLRPTAAAALTEICSRLSASDWCQR